MKSSFACRTIWMTAVLLSLVACGDDDRVLTNAPEGKGGYTSTSLTGVCEPGQTQACLTDSCPAEVSSRCQDGFCRVYQTCNAKGQWNSCTCDFIVAPRQSGGATGIGTSAGGNTSAGGTSAGGNTSAGGTSGAALASTTGIGTSAGGNTSLGGTSAGGTSAGGATSSGGNATATTTSPNRPPVITKVSFSSTAPKTNDLLTVSVEGTDPDSDPITYTYVWTRNGEPISNTSAQLDGRTSFSKGDALQVTVVPNDGKVPGVAVASQTIAVQNSAPAQAPTSTISPSSVADDGAALKCYTTDPVTDPDGDTITLSYTWWLNGVVSTQTADTVAASDTIPGQKWGCKITASDGSAKVAGSVSAQTQIVTAVQGTYQTNTTWVADRSPYYFAQSAQIGPNVTLTVEPGVFILGNNKQLQAAGGVTMIGTAASPIRVKDLELTDLPGTSTRRDIDLRYLQWEAGDLSWISYSTVHVSDCIFQDIIPSIEQGTGSLTQVFERNVFRNCCGLSPRYATSTIVTNNVFVGTRSGCTEIVVASGLTANYNSFLSSAVTTATINSGTSNSEYNYWGGLSDAAIPGQITDGNDDVTITGTVDYLPTLSAPHPDTPSPDKRYFAPDAP